MLNGHSWGHPGHCFRLYLQTPRLCSELGRVKVGPRDSCICPQHFPVLRISHSLLQGRGRWWAHPVGLSKQKGEGANGFEKTLAASTCCLISWSSDQGLFLHLHADLRLALTSRPLGTLL